MKDSWKQANFIVYLVIFKRQLFKEQDYTMLAITISYSHAGPFSNIKDEINLPTSLPTKLIRSF